MTARIAPLDPPYEPPVDALLSARMGRRGDVEPPRLFRTLARHDELASRIRPLGGGILGPAARVPARLREVMIQRTCAVTGADYEWGVHAALFGPAVGLSEDQLASTARGAASDPCWGADEALVFRLADELHQTSDISDELFAALRPAFADDVIIELLITAGWYHAIAYVCNGLRVAPEAWAPRLP
jgi:alkylhydroperoxidase family enzyme